MYAVPAAQGPISAATCGITPLARTSSRNRWPVPANSEPTASWIRAPAESSSQTNGMRFVSARSRSRETLISSVGAHRPGHDGEVVGADGDHTAINLPVPRDHAVGRRLPALEAAHRVVDPGVEPELGERPGLDEEVDALAGGQLPGVVLAAMRSGPPPSRARARRASRSSASGRRMDGAPPARARCRWPWGGSGRSAGRAVRGFARSVRPARQMCSIPRCGRTCRSRAWIPC